MKATAVASPRPFLRGGLAFSAMLAVSLCTVRVASFAAEKPAGLDPKVGAYFEKHCVSCHGPEKQKAEFRIDALSTKVGFENTPQWVEVMERINSGEMPPKKEKVRPSAEESARVVEWLAARMKDGETARMAARGRVSYNRLTRDEYVNTVRDLLGVQYDAADPGAFLEDPEWHGFERIGSVLTLSPSNIEKYLAAAEVILAEAYPESVPLKKGQKPPEPFGGKKPAIYEEQINEDHRERLRALGLLDKVRYEMWPGDMFRYSNLKDPLPEAGIYEISYTLSGLKPENGHAPRLKVYESKLDRVLFEQDIVTDEDKPVTVTFRAHLPKGRPNIDVYNEVPGPSNLPRSGRHGSRPFVSIKEGRIPWQMKLTDEQGRARYPFLIMDSISWRGPILSDEEQKLRAAFFPADEGNMEQVRECLGALARRAFRRPVTDGEIDGYVGIVGAELAANEKFRDAVKAGMLAILCSKSFVFIAEGDENANRSTLNDWEIASRLSYLLWSTMPDAELSSLAEKGKLHDKAELSRQVARMLADERATRFTDSFATQWLRLRKVGMFPPDKKLYPDYDKTLEASMVGESKAFFREVLQGGLTLREFVNSNWSMMNAGLAKFYGLPDAGLPRDGFQRVSLPADSKRGGLLTQAAILSLTSDGTRHRPVHRGVWLSEAIFGKTPPPPPANVEPIPTNPVDAPKATLRMKLEAHIHDARCAACHARIDPLGLAFENYDAIGRWRTEEVTDGTGANPKVNPSGKLPDGREYANADEFKKLLLSDLDAFNVTFIEKLATYGLRRSTSFSDRDDLKAIAAAGKAKDYRVRDIVEAFVLSDLFQKR
jgi:mono/diheme cytochrome c family protein